MNDVTRILEAVECGETQAAADLLPLVYDELRRLAALHLVDERAGQTLQPTALVHEAYLRLIGPANPGFSGRGHFFSAAAEAMRRILVEQARRKARDKHGGGWTRVDWDRAFLQARPPEPEQALALDEAVARLEAEDPDAFRLVRLRYYAGLTLPQAAEALGLAQRTAERTWTFARTWLRRQLAKDAGPGNGTGG